MARTWLSVTVELLGGRGDELWPWPGRIFAVGPSHTFAELAEAINDAFARWDRSHLSMFTLPDGRLVTDPGTGEELSGSGVGPIGAWLDFAQAPVAGTVDRGAEFQFTFDLGDEWVHRCVVEEQLIDPLEQVGITPPSPLPYWGWGAVPDQYGRRWADDDGVSRAPRRPKQPHPMLVHAWPDRDSVAELDLTEVRGSIAKGDVAAFLAAVQGCDIDDALQQVSAGVAMALTQDREAAESVAASVINRLLTREAEGDHVLAEDLTAALRGEPLTGRVAAVDLEQLTSVLEGDATMSSGGWLDLRTGDVMPGEATDPAIVGEEYAIDVEEDPDRWFHVECRGSRDGWRDMAAFAQRQRSAQLRERLERAIEGRGAFRRFRDVIHEEDLAAQWYAFANDLQAGRARQWLADEGIRVG